MRFTQIVDFRTKQLDEVLAMQQEWQNNPDNSAYNVDVQFAQDRDDSEHCMVLITFDSYEQAMENSQRPSTSEFSSRMMKLSEGEPRFVNLDVLREESSAKKPVG